jgi:hypothetical protein
LQTLVHGARALCDKERLHSELDYLKTTFKENGYSRQQIQHALNPQVRTSKPKDKPTSVALLPYVQTTYGRLSRMLAKHNIKSVGLPSRKISSFLRPVKDDLGLRTPGVYSIPCECGQVYIGQTGRSIDTRITEHSRHIRLGHPEKSAVTEHSFTHDSLIRFQDTQIPSTKSGYMDRLIRESIELEFRPNNMNREEYLALSGSWKPPFRLLRESRRHPPPPN